MNLDPNPTTRAWWVVPLRTVSGLNVREHFRARARRVKKERDAIALTFPAWLRGALGPNGKWCLASVEMTRFAPRELDDDAVPGSLKAVRDEVAKQLGLKSDRTDRVTFIPRQQRGPYSVGIYVELWPINPEDA